MVHAANLLNAACCVARVARVSLSIPAPVSRSALSRISGFSGYLPALQIRSPSSIAFGNDVMLFPTSHTRCRWQAQGHGSRTESVRVSAVSQSHRECLVTMRRTGECHDCRRDIRQAERASSVKRDLAMMIHAFSTIEWAEEYFNDHAQGKIDAVAYEGSREALFGTSAFHEGVRVVFREERRGQMPDHSLSALRRPGGVLEVTEGLRRLIGFPGEVPHSSGRAAGQNLAGPRIAGAAKQALLPGHAGPHAGCSSGRVRAWRSPRSARTGFPMRSQSWHRHPSMPRARHF
jgi:hypothetical protein